MGKRGETSVTLNPMEKRGRKRGNGGLGFGVHKGCTVTRKLKYVVEDVLNAVKNLGEWRLCGLQMYIYIYSDLQERK